MRKEEYWPERSLLYWSRTYDDINSGEEYDKLKLTYHIGIIDFDVFPDNDELYSEYKILNTRTGAIYTDKFCVRVLNLRHIDNPLGASPKVVKWAKYLKCGVRPLIPIMEQMGLDKREEFVWDELHSANGLTANENIWMATQMEIFL